MDIPELEKPMCQRCTRKFSGYPEAHVHTYVQCVGKEIFFLILKHVMSALMKLE